MLEVGGVLLGLRGLLTDVPTGRRDGHISHASNANNLPVPFDSVDVQKHKFAAKGLNNQDLVSLLGGHSIGTTSCEFVRDRLYKFNGNGSDPTIQPSFLPTLRARCPQNSRASNRVALDTGSEHEFDTSYFKNLNNGRRILKSDQFLWSDSSTNTFLSKYLDSSSRFKLHFQDSILNMSNIDLKTGTDGEIRNICSAIN